MIGIDTDRRLFYEGSGNYGHGVWPSPFISIASTLKADWSVADLPSASDLEHAKLVFREDFFDPVTRIRRGRFYVNPGTQPQEWHVQTHPAFKEEVGQQDYQGNLVKRLYSFQLWSAFSEFRSPTSSRLVALGFADAFTLWRVIDIERIVTGEDLVTMRARSPMGVLPELSPNAIPSIGRDIVLGEIEKVIDAAYRAGPESVIDRCRDAAQVCIGLWCSVGEGKPDLRKLDLSPLLEEVESLRGDEKPWVLLNAARIIARLHARKPSEKAKRGVRGHTESDAEVALANLGLILREVAWTRE